MSTIYDREILKKAVRKLSREQFEHLVNILGGVPSILQEQSVDLRRRKTKLQQIIDVDYAKAKVTNDYLVKKGMLGNQQELKEKQERLPEQYRFRLIWEVITISLPSKCSGKEPLFCG